MFECIYCLERKPASEYKKAEHVIPQSFGKFEHNLTLQYLVCDKCNQFFGDVLELALARDTLEGQARVNHRIKKAEEFRSPGPSSRLQYTIAEGRFKGALAFLGYDEANGNLTIQPVPQVGFRRKDSGEHRYFRVDDLPDKVSLEKDGYDLEGHQSIRIVGIEMEAVTQKLAVKGIKFRSHAEVKDQTSSILCQLEGSIDDTIRRGVAKIAFNYLARWEGGVFVRNSSFDQIRKFVRYGEKAAYPLVRIDQKAILADEAQWRRLGHLVTVNWSSDGISIVSQISLFNWLTYSVSLARDHKGERRSLTRGHFFNIANREIHELSVE
ncbi:hypothetical protein YTPLAS18_05690 [Nitrospira sp.]|nr:hypothetical protein YTPLAS18_05690 [Nitrospira sp.]